MKGRKVLTIRKCYPVIDMQIVFDLFATFQ